MGSKLDMFFSCCPLIKSLSYNLFDVIKELNICFTKRNKLNILKIKNAGVNTDFIMENCKGGMKMIKKTFKDLLREGRKGTKFIGTYLMQPSDMIIEIMKMAGFDFLIYDLEHERMTLSDVMRLVYVSEACGMVSVVRVPCVNEEYIKKVLDIGASCIKVPDIKTAEEAHRIVEYAKFPPYGHRGACSFVRALGYGSNPKASYAKANDETAISIIIEGPEGIANREEIISVDGIDSISIGQVDMSVTLGVPGEIFHPKVIDSILKCADLCLKYKKQLSVQIHTAEDIKLYQKHPAITHFHTDLPPTIFYKACKRLCDEIYKTVEPL